MTLLLRSDSLSDALCQRLYANISHRFLDEDGRVLRRESLCGRLLLHYALTCRCGLYDYRVICPKNGKPFPEKVPLHFSISHSGEYIMLAVSDSPVGCDVQLIGEYKQRIADRFFTEKERLMLTERENKTDTFFRLWVLKESILKERGEGISGGLSAFDFADYADKDSFSAFGLSFRIFGLSDAFACLCSQGEPENLEIISHTKITDLFI